MLEPPRGIVMEIELTGPCLRAGLSPLVGLHAGMTAGLLDRALSSSAFDARTSPKSQLEGGNA